MTNEMASRTMLKRIEQYNDRWSSHGLNTGIFSISDKLSAAELRKYEIFEPYPDKFLEKISPDVSVAVWKQDALLFEEGAYIDLAFFIVKGEVEVTLQEGKSVSNATIFDSGKIELPSEPPTGEGTVIMDLVALSKATATQADNKQIKFLATMDFNLPKQGGVQLGPGEFFGEIGALSGWPQSVTARTTTQCEVVQIRLPALRLLKNKSRDLKNRLDALYRERTLFSQLKSTPIFRECGDIFLERLTEQVELVSLQPDEILAEEGDPVDALYLVRSGFIKLMQQFGSGDLTISYLSKGMTLGELELLVDGLKRWEATAVSVEYAELVRIPKSVFRDILDQYPNIEDKLWKAASGRVKEAGYSKRDMGHSEFTQAALDKGLVQGSSILVIDLDVCTRCDDCVRACAATHDGRPRFVREGNKLGNLLIPKSCYHCRDPVCLVGCPTGAIHRAGVGEVVEIDGEICIGCSTCSNNCPYDAIVMHDMAGKWPGDMVPTGLRGKDRLQASKCDLCHDTGHGPACVSNCPQGCAARVGSLGAFQDRMTKIHDTPVSVSAKPKSLRAYAWFWTFVAAAVMCLATFFVNSLVSETLPNNNWGVSYGAGATALLAVVALFALRRRAMSFASRFRLGRSRTWLYVHLYGGLLFLLLVFMHTGFRLPTGTLAWWLWCLSIWTVLSGIAGLALQKWIPRVLSSGLGTEVLYERIPELIEEIRRKAEAAVESCSEPVRAFYIKKIAPDLAGPARRLIYFLDITGGIGDRLKAFDYLRDFLAPEEQQTLSELERLYKSKLEIDAQYTLQFSLRWWLYGHVPTSLLLIGFVAVHLFTVFFY